MSLLTLRNVRAAYGRIRVLHGISLSVREGEIIALIGANGAGKTTLLGAISGMMSGTAGEIEFDGRSLLGMRPERIVRRGVCQVPEGRRIFAQLSVEENLQLGAYPRYRGGDRAEIREDIEAALERFPVLAERRKKPAGNLSGGEQQMLAIARALMARPRLLLLDEPSMGLAPRLVAQILDIVKSLREDGATILLVEQNARAALEIADRGYVIEVGRVVVQGEARELLGDPEVKRAYLGKDYTDISER